MNDIEYIDDNNITQNKLGVINMSELVKVVIWNPYKLENALTELGKCFWDCKEYHTLTLIEHLTVSSVSSTIEVPRHSIESLLEFIYNETDVELCHHIIEGCENCS